MTELLKDLWGYMKTHKKFWLAPIILFLLALGHCCTYPGVGRCAVYLYSVLISARVRRRGNGNVDPVFMGS